MKILISGATGFLGSHLVKYLVVQGHEIIILKRSYSNIDRIKGIINNILFYDIDKTPLNKIFEDHNIDVIVHAATNYGKKSKVSEVIDSNVMFPLKLLELLDENNGKAFINTDTFFNNNNSNEYGYLNSYISSKKYFFELASKLVSKSKIKLINAKLEHLYGPDDDDSKFTMNIINALMKNEEEIDLTLGEQQRDFVHISDVISAYKYIIDHIVSLTESVSVFQIGRGVTYSIKEFVELAKELTNAQTSLGFGRLPYRENEIIFSTADTTELEDLGWSSTIDLREGILSIIASLNKNREEDL